MAIILAIVFSLLTAMANATSATFQWDAATKAPPEQAKGLHLALYLLHRREWLGAMGALILSFLFQAAALHEGTIAFVQPILVTELPFTLVLSAIWLGLDLDRREMLGAGAIVVGLGLFLGVGDPHGGSTAISDTTWIGAAVAVAAALVALVLVARTRGRSVEAAVLYGVSSGVAFTFTAVLVKATTARASGGIGYLFTGWQLYAMVGAGMLAVLLQQRAMHSGPLAAVKPASTVVNPLLSIVLSVVMFGEVMRGGLFVLAEVVGLAILVAGILELGRSPLVTGHQGAHPQHHERLASRRHEHRGHGGAGVRISGATPASSPTPHPGTQPPDRAPSRRVGE